MVNKERRKIPLVQQQSNSTPNASPNNREDDGQVYTARTPSKRTNISQSSTAQDQKQEEGQDQKQEEGHLVLSSPSVRCNIDGAVPRDELTGPSNPTSPVSASANYPPKKDHRAQQADSPTLTSYSTHSTTITRWSHDSQRFPSASSVNCQTSPDTNNRNPAHPAASHPPSTRPRPRPARRIRVQDGMGLKPRLDGHGVIRISGCWKAGCDSHSSKRCVLCGQAYKRMSTHGCPQQSCAAGPSANKLPFSLR
ncbi:hypothetical protein CONLIGDRAFT_649964 [Coniochaeta ligniaria NRRL 30616]|uniref:Uncharacterized protein n=1 Tax=Coniochaeta ligniaria NRRL 30616 TaxID=1408157 RepID=A0A1J7I6M3_9PEZI|nr:hypothetical protein CONLIGDRAFT_649964 [Coniochaeta ligniaria NRRL 30616]